MLRCWLIVALLGCAAAVSGCGPSVWESGFESAGIAAPAREKEAPVLIRQVPWETLQRALTELEADVAASDVHPDDWPEDRKTAARAKLLRGLQVSVEASSVQVLGRSFFRTTDEVRPDDGELAEFARRIGATQVVWSSTHLGKTDKIVQEAVTEYRTGWWDDPFTRDRRRRRSGSYSESATTWVPMTVQADEFAFIAYYLRTLTP
ncbi:MAG: hypothetical protein IT436_07900 [Phycisphaerales bacterium]|nr:hypothetical protein [Phycisphaerales bacterium]